MAERKKKSELIVTDCNVVETEIKENPTPVVVMTDEDKEALQDHSTLTDEDKAIINEIPESEEITKVINTSTGLPVYESPSAIADVEEGIPVIDNTDQDPSEETPEEEPEMDISEQLKMSQELLENSKDFQRQTNDFLSNLGVNKKAQKQFDEALMSKTMAEIKEMSVEDLIKLLGTKVYDAVSEFNKNHQNTDEPIDTDEMYKDFIYTIRSSMEMERGCEEFQRNLNKIYAENNYEYSKLRHQDSLFEALSSLNSKISDTTLSENEQFVNKLILTQLVDSLELESAKKFAKNKSRRIIDKEVNNAKKFREFENGFLKTLRKDTRYTYINPQGSAEYGILPMTEMITHLLPDDYKEYARQLYYILFKKFNTENELREKNIYVVTLLKNILAAYDGYFDAYKEKLIASMISVIDAYKAA